jgi:hypothetical protein
VTADPDAPVPYTLTAKADAELVETWKDRVAADLDAFYGHPSGTAARLFAKLDVPGADPEVTWEAVAEAADEWDCADSAGYQDRVDVGLEPEVGQ